LNNAVKNALQKRDVSAEERKASEEEEGCKKEENFKEKSTEQQATTLSLILVTAKLVEWLVACNSNPLPGSKTTTYTEYRERHGLNPEVFDTTICLYKDKLDTDTPTEKDEDYDNEWAFLLTFDHPQESIKKYMSKDADSTAILLAQRNIKYRSNNKIGRSSTPY
jgi:hypothetical protein